MEEKELFDYYFSETQREFRMRRRLPRCFVNGKEFTECIEHGKKPISNKHKDLQFVCTDVFGKHVTSFSMDYEI